jgi:hypothetical protein
MFDGEAVPPSVKVCTSRLRLVAGACTTGPSCPRCPPVETENRNISKANWKATGILTEDSKMSRLLPSGWVLQKAFDAIIRMVRHDFLMDYNSQIFLEIPLSTFNVLQESVCLLLTSVGNRYWRHPVSKAHPHIHTWTIATPLCRGLALRATGCLQGQPLSAPTQAVSGPYLANLIPQVISPPGILAPLAQVPAGPDRVQLPDRRLRQGAHAGRHGPCLLQAAQLGPAGRPVHVHQRHHQLPQAAALRRSRKCTAESTLRASGGAV